MYYDDVKQMKPASSIRYGTEMYQERNNNNYKKIGEENATKTN
jgi:hypothetical protein